MQTVILGLINPLMAMLFSAILGLLWWFDRSRAHNGFFAVAYFLLGTGFLISLLLTFSGPHWAFSYTPIPFSLGTIALIVGLARRCEIDPPTVALFLVAIAGFTMAVLIDASHGPVSGGLYISNTTYGILMLMGTSMMTHKPRETAADKAIFIMMVLATAQFFVRPAFSFAFETDLAVVPYKDTVYYAVLNTTVAVISVGLALSLVGAGLSEQFASHRDEISRDLLSGLLTRPAFEAQANELMSRSLVEGVPLSMIIGDIDHFKQVNDIWGHQVGDNAIAQFGDLVLRTSRDTDVAGRIGGEEFCILVWNADGKVANLLAERLRHAVSALQIEGMGPDIRLTSSFGCATRNAQESYASLFKRADTALYEAKNNGRNRVESADGFAPPANAAKPEPQGEVLLEERKAAGQSRA